MRGRVRSCNPPISAAEIVADTQEGAITKSYLTGADAAISVRIAAEAYGDVLAMFRSQVLGTPTVALR